MRIGFLVVTVVLALFAWNILRHGDIMQHDEVEQRQVLPMDVSFERVQAVTFLNEIRHKVGMNTLMNNPNLSEAAQAHADYLVANKESTHTEIEGHLNFTGVHPLDRTINAKYNSLQVSENLSTKNPNAKNSVDGLFSAIYHRFGFLNPNIDEVGVGVSQNIHKSANSAFVYVMGNSELNRLCEINSFHGTGRYVYGVCNDKSHRIDEKRFKKAMQYNKQTNPKIVLYPYDGQNEVPPAFYSEVPDPLPDYEVSGFPVSIEFNDYFFKQVQINSFDLFKGKQKVYNVLLMGKNNDPNARFSDKQYALFPLERLDYDTEYKAVVSYSIQGKEKKITWKFRTKKPTEKLHIVEKKEDEITIDPNISHFIYFKPLDGHDVMTDMQFPRDVDIEFIDNNTLKLTLIDKNIGSFYIRSKLRVLHVNIK